MYIGRLGGYFCCKQGLVGILPTDASGFCEDPSQDVAISLLATMTSQIGGTSVTPFGGYGTDAAGSTLTTPLSTGAGATTSAGGAAPTSGSTTTGSAASSTSTSTETASPKSGFNPGNGGIAGMAIAAAFLLGLIYIIWNQLGKRSARRAALSNGSRNPNYFGPNYDNTPQYNPSSQVHQYVPPSSPPPPVSPLFGPVGGQRYDPVTERVMSPAPAYKLSDAQELGGRPGVGVNVAEVPAHGRSHGDMGGRVEMG
jgi:hypothetical protein